MTQTTMTLRVISEDAQLATREAANLRKHLLEDFPKEVTVSSAKENQNTQDMGATLILVLGTPAILAIARGIADWLRKRPVSKFKIQIGDRSIEASGRAAGDPRLIQDLVDALGATQLRSDS